MQNLESRSEFSGRFVVSLRGELGHFAQSNCRKKQEKKPYAATDVSGGATPKKPGDACNGEHDKRSDTPAASSFSGRSRCWTKMGCLFRADRKDGFIGAAG